MKRARPRLPPSTNRVAFPLALWGRAFPGAWPKTTRDSAGSKVVQVTTMEVGSPAAKAPREGIIHGGGNGLIFTEGCKATKDSK